MNAIGPKVLRVVLVLAVIVLLLSIAGAINYALALRTAIAQSVEIGGWSVFIRSAVVLVSEGLSAGGALFFILRGPISSAYNSSGVFLTVMVIGVLLNGARLVDAPAWQVVLSAAWLSFLAGLIWRVVPNTSLNQNSARNREG